MKKNADEAARVGFSKAAEVCKAAEKAAEPAKQAR